MQIRLTVVDPLGTAAEAGGRDRAASCDVLVTAPAGTALAAVASGLAAAVSGESGGTAGERGRDSGGPVVLYAGAQRLDAARCTLGEPPLTDGAVLSLGTPVQPEPHPELDDAPAQLHVVAGPDAGGVHLLHGGEVRVGRSADADVPLDDPDVSRLHCAVTLASDGRVSVADLHSTNGTELDGTRVGGRPVRFPPGALLRIGESALRVAPAGGPGTRVATAPDGEGHVRVPCPGEPAGEPADGLAGTADGVIGSPAAVRAVGPDPVTGPGAATVGDRGIQGARARTAAPPDPAAHDYGATDWGSSGHAPEARAHRPVRQPRLPGQGGPRPAPPRGGGLGGTGLHPGENPGASPDESPDESPGEVTAGGRAPGGRPPGGERHRGEAPGGKAHGGRFRGGEAHGGGGRVQEVGDPDAGLPGNRARTAFGRPASGAEPGSGAEPASEWAAGPGRAHGSGHENSLESGHGSGHESGHGSGHESGHGSGPGTAQGQTHAGGPETHGAGVRLPSQGEAAGAAPSPPGTTPGPEGLRGFPRGPERQASPPGTPDPRAAVGGPSSPLPAPGAAAPRAASGGPGRQGAPGRPDPRSPAGPYTPDDRPYTPDAAYASDGPYASDGRQGRSGPAAGERVPAPSPSPDSPVPSAPSAPSAPSRLPAGSADPTAPGASGTPGTSGVSGDSALTGAPGSGAPSGAVPGARRKPTPPRGTEVPQHVRRRGGLTSWARRLAGGRGAPEAAAAVGTGAQDEERATTSDLPQPIRVPERWPDPATLLLTALGPGPRLWERGPGHPEALTVRLGTADRAASDGSGLLPAVPVTAGLREAGALGLAGPRPRLAGLARAVVAQLAALHSPDALEIVLISVDRVRPLQDRTAEWAWLGWLPHLRPGHGQDCRLLLAHDREQAAARTDELLRRLADHPDPRTATDAGPLPNPADSTASADRAPGTAAPARRPSWARADDGPQGAATGPEGATAFAGPYTVVLVDGDPGGPGLREAVTRLALEGPRAGIHVVCLAETDPVSPTSPVAETYEAACAVSPPFRACGAVALLSGDVATTLRLLRVARPDRETPDPAPVGNGTLATVDAVSPLWAERFARALAPLRPEGAGGRRTRVAAPLPQSARLLDELGLARATPASLMARWADAADDTKVPGGRARAVLGAGPRGPVGADLVADGPHLLVEGPPGSGRTELLRAVVASLASAERPDRLAVVLMDGRDRAGTAGGGRGDGLRACTDVPHVTTYLTAGDPVRMREFAQALSAELKRRSELLGRSDFAEWHGRSEASGRIVAQRTRTPARGVRTSAPAAAADTPATAAPGGTADRGAGASAASGDSGDSGTPVSADTGAADLDTPPSSTLRLRPSRAAARRQAQSPPSLPRLVVVVDDLDALVSPPLGAPGRPAAGSVMRALEAVAREGERLGVHLVAATGPDDRTSESEPARRASLRIALDEPGSEPQDPAPGRGRLAGPDGRTTPFQGGRVSGRIPRTATLRPTVVPLEWHRMGDPPARRPVRELGNGPTDLALLASALERAAREVSASEVPPLL
ncbi:FHA domain-containing protein [Streptomyces sp. MS06]|uniref:FHA domain-containing protein n=1 Tax=Streptomyces sp. MS06 TaxID=3385974 RepID=UPI0039A1E872